MSGASAAPVPGWALPGGVVQLKGHDLPVAPGSLPVVYIGDVQARVLAASSSHLRFAVPAAAPAGEQPIRIEPGGIDAGTLIVARSLATGLHQVDSPAYDGLGRLYLTHSGARGTKVAVPLYRLGPDGIREPLALDLPNPTSLALGPDGAMYVSSRFEGLVYRLDVDDRLEIYASDLGVPTGLAFSRDGTLYVGDRSGSILQVSPGRTVEIFASLPPSVAAYHLAFGPDDCLYVTAPTLSAHDVVYRITPDRLVDVLCGGFGRPQGLGFADDGMLYVAEALAGSAGIWRIDIAAPTPVPERVAASPVVVGLTFAATGGLVAVTSDTAWGLDVPLAAPAAAGPGR